EDLEDVVLDDVAERAGLLVERPTVLDAELLRDRDLHVVDVAAVPQRLEDRVREPQREDVLDGLLREVVVDPVDLVLREDLVELRVEVERGLQVVPERLLDDDALERADGSAARPTAPSPRATFTNSCGTVAR